MALPEITHLQALVLSILMEGEQSGRKIRERMAEAGELKSGPGFYQFMARLEDAGYAEGRYDQKVIDGQIIKERRYEIKADGIKAFEDARDFYLARAGLGFEGA